MIPEPRSAGPKTPLPEELRGFLERFTVSFEVSPESAVRGHAIRQVGSVVYLYGHDEPDRPLYPGDERCREILGGLFRIARWAVPAGEQNCRIDVDGVDSCLHYLHGAKGCGCVQVGIHIVPPGGPDEPHNADRQAVVEALVGRLEALGLASGAGRA